MNRRFAGNLLIAPPSVKGNFWYKTVILVTEDHANGSLGLVLNKRSQMSVKEFGEQLGVNIDLPGYLYLGGPVNVKAMSLLHTNEWSCNNTMRINEEVSISSSEDILPRLAMGNVPKNWRLFLGVCGWSPKQLIGEIKGDPPWNQNTSWCIAQSDNPLVFEADQTDQWVQALERSGQEFAQNMLV
jgi:putative transcriptional regulator